MWITQHLIPHAYDHSMGKRFRCCRRVPLRHVHEASSLSSDITAKKIKHSFQHTDKAYYTWCWCPLENDRSTVLNRNAINLMRKERVAKILSCIWRCLYTSDEISKHMSSIRPNAMSRTLQCMPSNLASIRSRRCLAATALWCLLHLACWSMCHKLVLM